MAARFSRSARCACEHWAQGGSGRALARCRRAAPVSVQRNRLRCLCRGTIEAKQSAHFSVVGPHSEPGHDDRSAVLHHGPVGRMGCRPCCPHTDRRNSRSTTFATLERSHENATPKKIQRRVLRPDAVVAADRPADPGSSWAAHVPRVPHRERGGRHSGRQPRHPPSHDRPAAAGGRQRRHHAPPAVAAHPPAHRTQA